MAVEEAVVAEILAEVQMRNATNAGRGGILLETVGEVVVEGHTQGLDLAPVAAVARILAQTRGTGAGTRGHRDEAHL